MNLPEPQILENAESNNADMISCFSISKDEQNVTVEDPGYIVEVRTDSINVYKDRNIYISLGCIEIKEAQFIDNRYIYCLQNATRGQVMNKKHTSLN